MTRALKAAMFTAALSAASVARAELITYTIDPAQSSLTISGNLTGNAASQQTTGSLTTSYSGTIAANRTPGKIEFPGEALLRRPTCPRSSNLTTTPCPATTTPTTAARRRGRSAQRRSKRSAGCRSMSLTIHPAWA